MDVVHVEFSAKIRLRSNGTAPASRHFVTLDKTVSEQIRQGAMLQPRKGRGSVRVEVRIGFYSRKTSIFPDKTSGCYVLPLKAEVRKALQVGEGDGVLVTLIIL